jgi:LysR family transcriptional activator of nhaA
MEWLNYHHLLYFWTVVRTGSVTGAGLELRLAPPTITAQIRRLESVLGEKLLTHSGRNVVPTEIGRVVYRYADEIFSLGREMMDTIRDRPTGRPLRLKIGVTDVLPKLVAHRLILPALQIQQPVRITCREAGLEPLLAALAIHELDVVLSDAPIGPAIKIRAFNHLLGGCGTSFLATPELARRHRKPFPRCLDVCPILLPTEDSALRRSLEQWFSAEGLRPIVIGEFDDFALLKVFGGTGLGSFAVPSVIEKQLKSQYRLKLLGRTPAVQARYFAISVERRLKHPAVMAICGAAREKLFG